MCSGCEVLEGGCVSEEQPEPQEEDGKGMLGRLLILCIMGERREDARGK